MSVSVLAEKTVTGIGEGPHWDEASNSLLYVDFLSKEIHRHYMETSTNEKVAVPELAGFVIPRTGGGCVIGQGRRLAFFDWESKSVQKHVAEADTDVNVQFNDAKCDSSGRLWAGTIAIDFETNNMQSGMCSLYSLDPDLKLTNHLDKIDLSNGIVWSRDDSVMYYVDSIPRKIYAFDFDVEHGTISNQRVAIDMGQKATKLQIAGEQGTPLGLPDGICMDQEGKLWVAVYFGAKVVRFDPETGKELQSIDIPALRTTSCCSGGPDYSELYVTCACAGADEAELKKYPLTGSVFKVTGLGVKGMPAHTFAG